MSVINRCRSGHYNLNYLLAKFESIQEGCGADQDHETADITLNFTINRKYFYIGKR